MHVNYILWNRQVLHGHNQNFIISSWRKNYSLELLNVEKAVKRKSFCTAVKDYRAKEFDLDWLQSTIYWETNLFNTSLSQTGSLLTAGLIELMITLKRIKTEILLLRKLLIFVVSVSARTDRELPSLERILFHRNHYFWVVDNRRKIIYEVLNEKRNLKQFTL